MRGQFGWNVVDKKRSGSGLDSVEGSIAVRFWVQLLLLCIVQRKLSWAKRALVHERKELIEGSLAVWHPVPRPRQSSLSSQPRLVGV
jgi:hypothetical protein